MGLSNKIFHSWRHSPPYSKGDPSSYKAMAKSIGIKNIWNHLFSKLALTIRIYLISIHTALQIFVNCDTCGISSFHLRFQLMQKWCIYLFGCAWYCRNDCACVCCAYLFVISRLCCSFRGIHWLLSRNRCVDGIVMSSKFAVAGWIMSIGRLCGNHGDLLTDLTNSI